MYIMYRYFLKREVKLIVVTTKTKATICMDHTVRYMHLLLYLNTKLTTLFWPARPNKMRKHTRGEKWPEYNNPKISSQSCTTTNSQKVVYLTAIDQNSLINVGVLFSIRKSFYKNIRQFGRRKRTVILAIVVDFSSWLDVAGLVAIQTSNVVEI